MAEASSSAPLPGWLTKLRTKSSLATRLAWQNRWEPPKAGAGNIDCLIIKWHQKIFCYDRWTLAAAAQRNNPVPGRASQDMPAPPPPTDWATHAEFEKKNT